MAACAVMKIMSTQDTCIYCELPKVAVGLDWHCPTKGCARLVVDEPPREAETMTSDGGPLASCGGADGKEEG